MRKIIFITIFLSRFFTKAFALSSPKGKIIYSISQKSLIFTAIIRFVTIIFLFFYSSVWSQQIRGKVTDSASQKPLAKASVFINSTSIGTTTNEKGEFSIDKFPSGKFDLVISFVGYQTLLTNITLPENNFLTINLKPKDDMLETVVVRSYEKNGWERWGFLFTNRFIGTTAFSHDCKIINPKDIRFSYSENDRILKAYAVKPLTIINKALGYKIEYDLEEFYYDMNSDMLLYLGFPLFAELNGSKSKQRRWQRQRQQTYQGSLLQFMRAVYQNKIQQAGFQIRRLVRKPNKEKERVKRIWKYYSMGNLKLPQDTIKRYEKILNQNDFIDILHPQFLTFNSIAKSIDTDNIAVNFKDYLYITYPKKKAAAEYYAQNFTARRDSCITALVTLNSADSIIVTSSGGFYNPTNLIMSGYWSWSEKIATMLPFDYECKEENL